MTICPGQKTHHQILNNLGEIPHVNSGQCRAWTVPGMDSVPSLYHCAPDHRTMQKSSEPSVPGCSESESGRVTAGLDQAQSQERNLRLLSSQEKPSEIPSFSWIKRHGRGMDFGFSKPFFLKEGLPCYTVA